MNTQQRDPIFESLDRLAGMADTDLVADRMPDIQRRVRVARQRRGAGLVAAAAVLAVGGAGVWQALPSQRTAPPVTNPGTTPWQEITVNAEPEGTDHVQPAGTDQVRISFTVTGESSAYADKGTGDPVDYAGPQSTNVLVDGKVVAASERGAISCEPGGELTPYTLKFHIDDPLVVPVSTPGEHTIVVKAPYCADGDLIESTHTVVVTTQADGFATADQLNADIDGDGTDDVVALLVPKDVHGGNQLLRVTWGTGETNTATLPNTMEARLHDPVDLDSDGDLELIVEAGGGDMAEGSVFLADANNLEQVKSVDAAGNELPLRSDTDPAAWQTYFGADAIYSYRLTDPAATQFPAPVEVRKWSLSGNTLIQSEKSVSQCVSFQPTTTLGPC